MVEIEKLKKKYMTVTAVENITMNIEAGRIYALLGPNGSGKTTLMKLLQKELEPTSGQIIVNGQNYKELKRKELPKLRRQMGMVFQDFRLLKDRTIFENVAFAQKVVEAPNRYIKRQVENMLDMVGLKDRMKAFPNELSGGEQQRVSIARAIAKNPKLLLCDEPTGALDYTTGKQILKTLQDTCRNTGTTVIVITHNSALAPMADRVIRINDAKVRSIEVNSKPSSVETIEW